MKQAQVRKGLRNANATSVRIKAGLIVKRMTENAELFPDVADKIEVIQMQNEELKRLMSEAARFDRRAISLRDACVLQLKHKLAGIADYVQSKANGNAQIIIASGFDLRKTEVRKEVPSQCIGLRIRNMNTGEVELRWRGNKKAIMYNVQFAKVGTGNELVWQNACSTIKAKCIIANLDHPAYYCFQVAAVNRNGQSAWTTHNRVVVG